MKRITLGLLMGLMALLPMGAASATQLGDPAPALSITDWVKGAPVDLAAGKGKNIYVVEFWATWCGPCRASIPHLSELQAKFKDKGVTFIGVSDETRDVVEPYVQEMGDKMDYTVALDPSRETYASYMAAFGQNGIPHAFIVDRSGAIVWHGHPMNNLEGALQQIIDGTYDLEILKRAAEAQALVPEFGGLVMSGEDHAAADALGARIVELGKGNPDFLNELSWTLLTNPDIKYRNLDLAMSAAKTAYDASGGKDANIIDTYARAYYEKGDLKRAIALEKEAVELNSDPRFGEILQETLTKYETEAAGS